MLFTLFEKVSFAPLFFGLAMIGAWFTLLYTVMTEVFLYTIFLVIFSKGRRLEYTIKGILVTPLRYGTLAVDIVTVAQFLFDLGSGQRNWRK